MSLFLKLLTGICAVSLLVVGLIEIALYISGDALVYSDLPRATFGQYFYDLRIWSMNMLDCPVPIEELSGVNHCASEFYVFDYPSYPLYILRFLGFDSSSHGLIGTCLGLFSMISTIFLTLERPLNKWAEKGKISLVLLGIATSAICTRSLPLRYAIERGQIDTLVYIAIACIFVYIKWREGRRCVKFLAWTFILLAFAALSLVKIYPIASLTWFCLLGVLKFARYKRKEARRVRLLVLVILPAILTIVCLLLLAEPITIARAANSFRVGGHGFGLSVLTDAGYSKESALVLETKVLISAAFFLSTLWIFKDADHLCFWAQSASKSRGPSGRSQISPQSMYTFPVKAEGVLFLAVFPFLTALYLSSESINYKIIFVIALIPWIYTLIDSNNRPMRLFGLLQLMLGLIIIFCPGVPFEPSLYLYVEWFNHFFCQPAFFGCIAGQGLWLSWQFTSTPTFSKEFAQSYYPAFKRD